LLLTNAAGRPSEAESSSLPYAEPATILPCHRWQAERCMKTASCLWHRAITS